MRETPAVEARPLASTEERLAAIALYRKVFGLDETSPAMSTKLLVALQRHGGSAVGAFDAGGRLVGFSYGFVGLDGGVAYHHSQAAVVDPRVQGRGVGRLLKYAQRDVAQAAGVATMRWAYDPVRAVNAHFNLDVLGARGRWVYRNYYDACDESGPSDRVMVEWRLDEAASTPGLAPARLPDPLPECGSTVAADGLSWLAVPTRWDVLVQGDQAGAVALRERIVDELARLVSAGFELSTCRLGATTSVYGLVASTP
jgi:predicted GNAT superfamily acetyltransferase